MKSINYHFFVIFLSIFLACGQEKIDNRKVSGAGNIIPKGKGGDDDADGKKKDSDQNENDPPAGGNPPPAGSITDDGVALYQQNCASCHNPLTNSNKLARTKAQIQAAIQGIPQMSGLSGLTEGQITAIAYVLANATVGPILDQGLNKSKLLLSNRVVLSSKLKQLFAPVDNNAILKDNIGDQVTTFGSPCNANSESCVWDRTGDGTRASYQRNVEGIRNTAPIVSMVPLPSTLRSGYLFKSCEEIMVKPANVQAFLTNAAIDRTKVNIGAAEIQAAVMMIASGRTLSEATALKAKALFDAALEDSNNDVAAAWQILLLAFCQSPLIEVY